MNKNFQMLRSLMALLLLIAACLPGQAQNTATCSLYIGGVDYPVNAYVQATSLTGLDFNLSITVPGLVNCGGNYDIKIATSNNLLLGSNASTPFSVSNNVYKNIKPIPTDSSGEDILVAFKFKPGVTCNGEKGTFMIDVSTMCAGSPVGRVCQLEVSLNAIAKNYWQVEKKHLWGNLKGGNIMWKIRLYQTPHPLGIGDYNIVSGTIQDDINCDSVISVTNVTGAITRPHPNSARWNTGPVSSLTSQIEYIVTTICCDPNEMVATNCASVNLDLGKYTGLNKYPCATFDSTVCDSIPMVTVAGCVVPFSKALVNSTTTNYATGCEGEYLITIVNNGNTPINNLVVSDVFPPTTEIEVTKITISATSGVKMDYKVDFGNGPINNNFNNTAEWNFPPPPPPPPLPTHPPKIHFETTSGSLTYGVIYIRVRFTIKAPESTVINNCANLAYSGTFDGWGSLCNITYPPCPTQNDTSCIPFTVQPPKVIPGLAKCRNGKDSYFVGEPIQFHITLSNHGQSTMTGYTLSDLLGPTSQNLTIQGPVQYSFGTGDYNGYTGCYPSITGTLNTAVPPQWLTTNNDAQYPSWNINGMPGECRFDKAYYLVITFWATVNPQNNGQYTNTATLLTSDDTILTDSDLYNVLRTAKIQTIKSVNSGLGQPFASTGYVDLNGNFQYRLRVINNGTVKLKDIKVTDAFPSCVQFACPLTPMNAIIRKSNGTSTVQVTCTTASTGATTFALPPSTTLGPAEYVDIIVDVKRISETPEPCCNIGATGYGTAADTSGQTIQDSDREVCVSKSICCGMEDMSIRSVELGPWNLNYWNVNLTVFASNLPIEKVDISVIDYHFTYSNSACKPPGVGNNLGNLITSTSTIGGGLTLKTPNTFANNLLIWNAGTPVMFKSGQTINVRILRPLILPLSCCNGKFYYCLKVRLKDVKCRICEKIVCFEVPMGTLNHPMEIQEKLDILEQDFIEGN